MQRWLYDHPRWAAACGWHRHRVIHCPEDRRRRHDGREFLVTDLFLADDWVMPAIVGGILVAVATLSSAARAGARRRQ
jgi:hypothetical protein